MKQNCKNILPFIPLLADDALPQAKADQINKHLSVCPACRRELDVYRSIKSATGALSAPKLSSDFHEKLMENIKKDATPKQMPISRPMWRRYAAGFSAAAALVALSVVTYLGLPQQPSGTNLDDYGIKVQQPADNTAENSDTATSDAATSNTVTSNTVTSDAATPAPQMTVPQVTQSQVTQSQVTKPQGTQPRGTEPSRETPSAAPSDDTMTYPTGPSTSHQDAPSQASSAPQVAHATASDESPKSFATYRVYVEKAHLNDAEKLLASLPKDTLGYRAETGAQDALKALSALSGYRMERVEDNTLTADYICLIGE